MVYRPQGFTKAQIFFHLLKKGRRSFDELDYFLKKELGIGKGKGLDTVKDVIWGVVSSKIVKSSIPIRDRSDRNIEKSYFEVIELFTILDMTLVYLTLYSWGPEYAREFQKNHLYRERIDFNLDELHKIISGHADSGTLPEGYSYTGILKKFPKENPKEEKIYFYCDSSEDPKYKMLRDVLLRNVQSIGADIKRRQPFFMRILSQYTSLNYSISEWQFPVFKHFQEKLLGSPEFAMSFFRTIAEFLEEANHKNLPMVQQFEKTPQGLQRLWGMELNALDPRLFYYSKGPNSLWPNDATDAEIETGRRIRYRLLDDAPLYGSKTGLRMLFVLFLTLHGTIGEYDRGKPQSETGLRDEELQYLLDNSLNLSELVSYEDLRLINEEHWITEILPSRRGEVKSILRKREERLLRNPKSLKWTKEEAYALCMDKAEIPLEKCYSLFSTSREGIAIIRE